MTVSHKSHAHSHAGAGIAALGFTPWFAARRDHTLPEHFAFARVCAVDRGTYRVSSGGAEAIAELSGRLAFNTLDGVNLPCVGDWIVAQYYNDGTAAIIHQVLPRQTCLCRRMAGTDAATQTIAANVDTAFLVQSCHTDFNPNRLDRYLVMARTGGVLPVVLLTKTDLVPPATVRTMLATLGDATGAQIVPVSSLTGEGLETLQGHLSPGKTYCLLGSSGVGKSTLINTLRGDDTLQTAPTSASGEGTHTTTRRQLVRLPQGALLVDTPGMRELGIADTEDNVSASYADITLLAQQCRYADCSHQQEAGCAVRDAISSGELSAARYHNYLKLLKESAHYAMSHVERRHKDKAFGKMVRKVKALHRH